MPWLVGMPAETVARDLLHDVQRRLRSLSKVAVRFRAWRRRISFHHRADRSRLSCAPRSGRGSITRIIRARYLANGGKAGPILCRFVSPRSPARLAMLLRIVRGRTGSLSARIILSLRGNTCRAPKRVDERCRKGRKSAIAFRNRPRSLGLCKAEGSARTKSSPASRSDRAIPRDRS